jgi:tetratricopeptide (TPR) repeat protein
LGHIAYRQRDYPTALNFYMKSIGYFREVGDLYGTIVLLGSLMNVLVSMADYKGAKAYAEERLEIALRIGHKRHIAESLNSMGLVSTLLNQEKEAHRFFRDGLMACSELQRARDSITAECLTGLASLFIKEGKLERGVQLLGSVDRPPAEREGELDSVFQDVYDQALSAVQEQLGEETFAELRAIGEVMTLDQAISYGLENNSEAAKRL